MNQLGPDRTEEFLHGYSWHLSREEYDLAKRVFLIRVLKDLDSNHKERELLWEGVRAIDIQIEESDIDDNCMDSIIGIQEMNIDGLHHINVQTEKHGISFIAESSVKVNDY